MMHLSKVTKLAEFEEPTSISKVSPQGHVVIKIYFCLAIIAFYLVL